MTRVLVVEDEESYSDALSYMLRKEGFEVALAADGNTAIETYDRTGADIVLLDLMLPGMPGTEVCRELRRRSNVPVIMVTAKDTEVDKVVGLELGADDYVTKPFSPRELIARVKAVLRRSAAQAQRSEGEGRAVIRAGPIEIDRMSRRVVAEGCEVNLTPREFDLLVTLAAHPDRVFTRQGLLDAVWGYDYFGDPRTVDVYIRRLRRKLPPAAAACVETVWGVGYRFVVGKP
ncbi:MAG TPA: response regulator transcription factor [Actinopolymorphaceae bacterium]